MVRMGLLVLVCSLAVACRTSLDIPESAGLQPLPGASSGVGLPAAASPDCRAARAGEVLLNEYLVRPGGVDIDGDGKSNSHDEVIELTLTTWPEGADELRLDHLLKLPDGGASLEMRTADNQLLFRHQYLPEPGGAPSSWTRAVDGDGASDWTRQLDWMEGHGRSTTIGLCNSGQPACACLASQGMDCGESGDVTPTR